MPNYTICLQANNFNTSRETLGGWLARLPAKCNSRSGNETTRRAGQELARDTSGGFLSPSPTRQTRSNLFCRHPWLMAWPCAAGLGLYVARRPRPECVLSHPTCLPSCARPRPSSPTASASGSGDSQVVSDHLRTPLRKAAEPSHKFGRLESFASSCSGGSNAFRHFSRIFAEALTSPRSRRLYMLFEPWNMLQRT